MSSYQANEEQERKLFVGGLNKSNTDEDVLKGYFEKYGNIIDCTVMRDQDRESRGFGFILFEDSSSIDKIISAKKGGDDFIIDDHHIEIKRALPKVPGGNAGTSRMTGLNRKIFVGGLPSSITEDDLRQYFESYGRVNEVELLRDRDTMRLRGFAFVTFDEEDSADKCMQRRTHEICKKICEVKRAQNRSDNGNRDGGRRPQGDRNGGARSQPASAAPGTMPMSEVNRLIQQAFMMGQQSVQSVGVQVPTVASLLNGGASASAAPTNNVLLQALMGQAQAPTPAPAPVPAPVAPSNTAALTQLASLLQGGGIDANALAGLLKKPEPTQPPTAEQGATGYSTSYPSVSSYDYTYKSSSNYGPSKDDGKRGYQYNPY